MNKGLTFLSFSTVLLGLAATSLLFESGPAIAQQSDEGIEEIIVIETPAFATRNVRTSRERIRITELARSVSYSDLDLTLYKDVAELKSRIDASAKEVCKQLADEYPRLKKPEPTCIRSAVASATKKADEVVAAANEVFAVAH